MASLVAAQAIDAQADPPAPLPAAIRARITALVEAATTTPQACVDRGNLASLVTSAPQHAVEISSETAQQLHAASPSPAGVGGWPGEPRQADGTTAAENDAECRCDAEIAATVTEAAPNQASDVNQALTDVNPRCGAAITSQVRETLMQLTPESSPVASSGSLRPPVGWAPPPEPPAVAPSGPRRARSRAGTPETSCDVGSSCGVPLPRGDTPAESPTRLGGRG